MGLGETEGMGSVDSLTIILRLGGIMLAIKVRCIHSDVAIKGYVLVNLDQRSYTRP